MKRKNTTIAMQAHKKPLKKKKRKTSFVEKCIHITAFFFIIALPFSLLYIESRKLEIADQTAKTQYEIGKEKSAMSEDEVKLNMTSKTSDRKKLGTE